MRVTLLVMPKFDVKNLIASCGIQTHDRENSVQYSTTRHLYQLSRPDNPKKIVLIAPAESLCCVLGQDILTDFENETLGFKSRKRRQNDHFDCMLKRVPL